MGKKILSWVVIISQVYASCAQATSTLVEQEQKGSSTARIVPQGISPIPPEKSLTSSVKNKVEWKETGIDVTTNSCKWDYQLISKEIPIVSNTPFELDFEVCLRHGGFGVKFLSQDRKKFLGAKYYQKPGLVKDTLKLPFGTTDESVYLIFTNNLPEAGVSHFIIKNYTLTQSPLSPEKILTPFSPQKVERTGQGIEVTTNPCKWDSQLISKPIPMTLAAAPEVSFEVDLKKGGFSVRFLSHDQKKFLASKHYQKPGLVKDTLELPADTTEKSIYLVFTNALLEPGVSHFVIKDYVLTQNDQSYPDHLLAYFHQREGNKNIKMLNKGHQKLFEVE
ncbi:hypothetical protein IM40_09170 [Candidatus Paracaedimonas acanthamoebae]|nr:hypothetical protein IM40_09170 [Candidatus Paracaedimonas acanthamoebae]